MIEVNRREKKIIEEADLLYIIKGVSVDFDKLYFQTTPLKYSNTPTKILRTPLKIFKSIMFIFKEYLVMEFFFVK